LLETYPFNKLAIAKNHILGKHLTEKDYTTFFK